MLLIPCSLPRGFASILWKDSRRSAEAAEQMRMGAAELKRKWVFVEKIIPEYGQAQEKTREPICAFLKKSWNFSASGMNSCHLPCCPFSGMNVFEKCNWEMGENVVYCKMQKKMSDVEDDIHFFLHQQRSEQPASAGSKARQCGFVRLI